MRSRSCIVGASNLLGTLIIAHTVKLRGKKVE